MAHLASEIEYSMEEVKKHNTKEDCWVVIHGHVLNVTEFLHVHPGGVLPIFAFAGKNATEEFKMIHDPHVLEHFVHMGGGTVMGMLEKEEERRRTISVHEVAPSGPVAFIKGYIFAVWYMAICMLYEVGATIIWAKVFKITLSNDRKGLTRSAMWIVVFVLLHAAGNLFVFLGPDMFNGYAFMMTRLYWTSPGTGCNFIEVYTFLCLMMHVTVALKRTWDMKLTFGVKSGQLNLAVSGIMILTFLLFHMTHMKYGDTEQFGPFYVCAPPYMVNFGTLLDLKLDLWFMDKCANPSPCRDVYALEFQLFSNHYWSCFYLIAIWTFCIHGSLGIKKVVPALGIPKVHQAKATNIGLLLIFLIALIYTSFPVYIFLAAPQASQVPSIQIPTNRVG